MVLVRGQIHEGALVLAHEELRSRLREYSSAIIGDSSKKEYLRIWVGFDLWCQQMEFEPVPASSETLMLYLAAHDQLHPSTLDKNLAAIGFVHRMAGIDPPPTRKIEVREIMKGIRRKHGSAQDKKRPLKLKHLKQIVFPDTLLGLRDRALLFLGFAAALRRSELVAVQIQDLSWEDEGFQLRIPHSKTDPTGQGQTLAIPHTPGPGLGPTKAVYAWLQVLDKPQGPLFRRIDRYGNIGQQGLHPSSVGDIVKHYVNALGLDSTKYGAHSLRAGLATSGAEAQTPESIIKQQTRHKSDQTLRGYIRLGTQYVHNVVHYLDWNEPPTSGSNSTKRNLHKE